MISKNSDHPPEYITPRNWNGNTHSWFGFGLSEVVWHVDAVVGTGGLVVAGGLVEAGELEGSGKDIMFYENMTSIKKLGTRYEKETYHFHNLDN